MNLEYEFRKIDHIYGALTGEDVIYDYGVTVKEEHLLPLEQIEWWGWTPKEIQLIIDNCNSLGDGEDYEYQVEGSDLIMLIDKTAAHFFDPHSSKKEADLIWSFTTFIEFDGRFKVFVEKNR